MAKKYNKIINGKQYFRVTRTIGHEPNGKPIKKEFYGDGEKDANKKADEFMEKLKKGVITNDNKILTINILFPKWLFTVKINELKDTSIESYEGTYRNYIKPYKISNQDISDLKSIMIQNYYNELYKDDVSSSNIRKVHKVLNPFFKYVEKEGYIFKNPCANTTIPKDKNVDIDKIIEKERLPFNYFTADEIPILRKAFSENKYKHIIDFALGTGMRQGEIVGLEWKNVDLDRKEIYVKSNITRSANFDKDGKKIGYKTKKGTPKTDSSIRVVPISQHIYELLDNLPRKSKYVFSINDRSIDKKDLEKNWRKTLKQIVKEEENFQYRKFHDLRHTFAVLLLLNNVDLYTIMKLLGHKKLSSTEIYLAVLPQAKTTSVNKLNYIFNTESVNNR